MKELVEDGGESMDEKWPLIIIGGGPGGYVAAIRASQLKKKVLLIEEDRIGGTCMNYGCIPSKYLLHETRVFQEVRKNKKLEGPRHEIFCNWKLVQEERAKIVDRLVRGIEFLLERGGASVVKGRAFLKNERQILTQTASGERVFEFEKMILATGSRSAALPFLKPDGQRVITSKEALELDQIPRSMIVVGAGAIGLEMGTVYARLGTDVTILEVMPTLLPGSDREMVARLDRILRKQGLKIQTEMRIERATVEKDSVTLIGTSMRTQAPFSFRAEKVLLAAGRKPNSEEILRVLPGLAAAEGGPIRVDSFLETAVPGIYAIGDLIGGKLLAHKASHEGIAAVGNAAGGRASVDYRALPLAVFTDPEFASVGLTEDEAKESGVKTQVGLFSLQASSRALTMESPDGMIKIIAGPEGRIVGAHLIAPNASEVIAEISLAIHRGLTIDDISSTIHIHPTISESVMEAALKAKNEAIHILNT